MAKTQRPNQLDRARIQTIINNVDPSGLPADLCSNENNVVYYNKRKSSEMPLALHIPAAPIPRPIESYRPTIDRSRSRSPRRSTDSYRPTYRNDEPSARHRSPIRRRESSRASSDIKSKGEDKDADTRLAAAADGCKSAPMEEVGNAPTAVQTAGEAPTKIVCRIVRVSSCMRR